MNPQADLMRRSLTGLVLSGGGARAAYQAGVLRGLIDLGVAPSGRTSFDIVVGSSAGAINAGALAAFADRFGEGVDGLERVWGAIRPEQVFRTDLQSLGKIGFQWIRDLSFGGVLRRTSPKSLLDTGPLRAFLAEHVPLARIGAHVESGTLRALAILATNLYTADGVVFVQAGPDVALWRRGRWSIERATIGVDHLMASSAIPIFFPTVEIEGRHFGDGAVRNTAPLSPAINLGADRIVAIGVSHGHAPETKVAAGRKRPPTVAQVAAALLDAVLLDAIEVDVEHSGRVNHGIVAVPCDDTRAPLRWIDVLWIAPSRSIGAIAAEHAHRIPAIVRYLMRGLGDDESTVELASYLLFDAAFCRCLMELGRADVAARSAEIEGFFAGRSVRPVTEATARGVPLAL
jgi:NTE family protein